MKKFSFGLDQAQLQELRDFASSEGRSMADVCRTALTAYLRDQQSESRDGPFEIQPDLVVPEWIGADLDTMFEDVLRRPDGQEIPCVDLPTLEEEFLEMFSLPGTVVLGDPSLPPLSDHTEIPWSTTTQDHGYSNWNPALWADQAPPPRRAYEDRVRAAFQDRINHKPTWLDILWA